VQAFPVAVHMFRRADLSDRKAGADLEGAPWVRLRILDSAPGLRAIIGYRLLSARQAGLRWRAEP
jgi:hypothetical protein